MCSCCCTGNCCCGCCVVGLPLWSSALCTVQQTSVNLQFSWDETVVRLLSAIPKRLDMEGSDGLLPSSDVDLLETGECEARLSR